MIFLPVLSTLVTFGFALSVFFRYRRKGGLHLLLWAFGLLLYGLGTLSEVVLGLVFNPLVLKIWYLTGAILTAAWLGQGSIQLLVRRPHWARNLAFALSIMTAISLILVALAPLTGAETGYDVTRTVSSQYREILIRNGLLVFMTIIMNIYGTIGLVGGAAYSAFLFWRKKVLAGRMLGNLLIALGALAPALAGTLSRTGILDALYLSELVGVILMFCGFILSTNGKD